MTAQEIFQLLRERFGEKTILALYQTDTSDRRNPIVFDPPQIHVAGAQIAAVCRYLKEHEATRFEALMSLSGVDNGPVLSVIYHLHSMSHRHKIALRADNGRAAIPICRPSRSFGPSPPGTNGRPATCLGSFLTVIPTCVR
ncbi:MAG: hypothetical protein KatS3mg115_0293 [Candidatus Poribacteria bacterium]|nr:MAG: hypothetical protein KatS3mg115_0293 [Candidatus Poribacteria bacterium]